MPSKFAPVRFRVANGARFSKKARMKLRRIAFLAFASASLALAQPQEPRTWTDAEGNTITGIYLNATEDTVTIRRVPDGQAFRLKLADCKPEERDHVARVKKDAREAESFDATVSGEITWRLPGWTNLSWSTQQPAELWLWDEATKSPTEKLASLTVTYESSDKRNEFFGTYASSGPVRLWKPARYVIKARFAGTVNSKEKSAEEISAPMTLPAVNKEGAVKLNIVRFSLTR